MPHSRFLSACLAVACWASASLGTAQPSVTSSVVKLDVVSDPPDLLTPWQTEGVKLFGGSGVLIEGNRILTNAHVVESAVSIEVKRAGERARFPAKVSFISHDADLALLEVEDAGFFEGARALPLGKMPALQQGVVVYGFPVGGNTLSITSGIVSRIEVDTYAQSYRSLLSVQIDAAINEGNSGGPVITDGTIVGIAMQGLEDADNVAYMIPPPVIAHFLEDVKDGRYDGFPTLGIALQDMESEAQRRASMMEPSQSGALVLRVDYGSPAHGVLQPRDVILSIDGHDVANDLTVAVEGVGRVDLAVTYQSKQIGDTIDVVILRRGQLMKKRLRLTPHVPLVPGRRLSEWPRYVQFGGLVFQPLSEQLLDEADAGYADAVSYAEVYNLVTRSRREILLLAEVLPHPVNRGYQDFGGEVVRLVNGVVPRDLDHLASILDAAKGPWLRVVTGHGDVVTLDLEAARRANPQILVAYGIPEDRHLGRGASKATRRRRR